MSLRTKRRRDSMFPIIGNVYKYGETCFDYYVILGVKGDMYKYMCVFHSSDMPDNKYHVFLGRHFYKFFKNDCVLVSKNKFKIEGMDFKKVFKLKQWSSENECHFYDDTNPLNLLV